MQKSVSGSAALVRLTETKTLEWSANPLVHFVSFCLGVCGW